MRIQHQIIVFKTYYHKQKRIYHIKNYRTHPKPREFFSGCKFNHSMIIFGGRVGEKKVNDMYIWNISCPSPSRKHCTLRQEMLQLYYMEDNQGDMNITCKYDNKSIKAHSYIIKHRSHKLYEQLKQQNLVFQGDSKLLNHILHFIYGGEVNFHKITPEVITDLISFSLSSDFKHLFRMVILHCLVTSINQRAYSEVQNQNVMMDKNSFSRVCLLGWNLEATGSSIPSTRNQNKNTDVNVELFKTLHSFQTSFDTVWNLNTKLYYQDMLTLKQDVGSSNFILDVGNKQFKVHKAILAARCAYFESCFGTDNMLQQKDELVIEPFLYHDNPNLVEFFISFLYNGLDALTSIKMTSDNLVKCLDLTNYFMVKSPTFNYIIENAIFNQGLTINNCMSTIQFAEQFHAQFLKNKTLTFMVQNMNPVLNLNPQLLVEMLKLQNEIISSQQQ